MSGTFQQKVMPTEVGYYHAWHKNCTCDGNRYRYIIVRVISIDNKLQIEVPWAGWDSTDVIMGWGDKIEIPRPPEEWLEKINSQFHTQNNVTKFKYRSGGSEFEFQEGDLPIGSNCRVTE